MDCDITLDKKHICDLSTAYAGICTIKLLIKYQTGRPGGVALWSSLPPEEQNITGSNPVMV
jgi:hypothetical protein